MTDNIATEPRAQTLRAQRFVNRLVRGLLRTPLACRLLGNRLITVYVPGRKTGRRYTVPVAYTRREDALLIGSPFNWIRNLRSRDQVDVRLRGRRVRAEVDYIADETGVTEAYAIMARDNHNFAKFNQIRIDADGEPNRSDLHLAWDAGARAARLTVS
jgi:deazaflavin-dependent oxidoreductase (nitroreductase family)